MKNSYGVDCTYSIIIYKIKRLCLKHSIDLYIYESISVEFVHDSSIHF